MRKKILLAIVFLGPLLLQAQVNLTTQFPADGMMLKDQLWNVLITNNTPDAIELRLSMDVRDVVQGQSVLNASSGKMLVGRGLKVITIKDVQPVIYNFTATEFSGSYLPCGIYTVSYQLIQETTKGDVPVASELVKINVSPLSPALLSSPSDKSAIEELYPQFTWMPPAPAQMFNPLLYDIVVVAIEEGQSAREAIDFNTPVYFNTNLQYPVQKVPTSFSPLKKGKTYAWQVVARGGATCATPTEIWTFSIGKDSVAAIIEQAPFVKISQNSTEITVMHQGVLKMEYVNETYDKQATFIVYKVADRYSKNRKVIQFDLPLANGKNFLTYDVLKKIRLDEKTVYEVSMINGRAEEWLMKFIPVYHK